jgi:hypothetical protein
MFDNEIMVIDNKIIYWEAESNIKQERSANRHFELAGI